MAVYYHIADIKSELPFCKELAELLELLEKINPCNQAYHIDEGSFTISYSIKLNLLNFKHVFPLRASIRIIGLPVSICGKGYWGKAASVEKAMQGIKGLKVILNADNDFKNYGRTLSTFVFDNRFSSFEDYLERLRSSYRRRILRAIEQGKSIICKDLKREAFNENHYDLYLSIMNRTQNPLETLPMQFFTDYDAELYEFVDESSDRLLGFIQLKEFDEELYFLFGGFRIEDNEPYDLYFNMLIKVLQLGIEKGYKTINFGQTAEESKLKIGCREVPKYLYVHHSNPIINAVLPPLVPIFSYKPYGVQHHVFKNGVSFKEEQEASGGIGI